MSRPIRPHCRLFVVILDASLSRKRCSFPGLCGRASRVMTADARRDAGTLNGASGVGRVMEGRGILEPAYLGIGSPATVSGVHYRCQPWDACRYGIEASSRTTTSFLACHTSHRPVRPMGSHPIPSQYPGSCVLHQVPVVWRDGMGDTWRFGSGHGWQLWSPPCRREVSALRLYVPACNP